MRHLTCQEVCDLADDAYNRADITNKERNVNVAITERDGELIFTFRGTQDHKNVLEDLDFDPSEWNGYRVHDGFRQDFESVKNEIRAKIDSCDLPIRFVGHSLGGALAILAYCHFSIVNVSIYRRLGVCDTIGCPRVFFGKKPGYFRMIPNLIYRYRNDQDIITHVPTWTMGYRHVGKMVQVGKWWRFWTMFLGKNNAHMTWRYRNSANGK